MNIKFIAVLVSFTLLIQSTTLSYAQNASSDVQVKQIKECFNQVLDSETLSPENLARFDLGDGTAPDELSMLKGLTLWALDMKDYHEGAGGIRKDYTLYVALFFSIIGFSLAGAKLGVTLFKNQKFKYFRTISFLSYILIATTPMGLMTTQAISAKPDDYLFQTDKTNSYLLSLMDSNSPDEFWQQLGITNKESNTYRNQILAGCGNVLSFKKTLEVDPARIFSDLSERNQNSDLEPVFQTPQGQSFVFDHQIIQKMTVEFDKDRVNMSKIASLMEQAADTSQSHTSAEPRVRSNIAENPVTTCASNLSGIYQLKDLITKGIRYWKVQQTSEMSEAYQIEVSPTKNFSDAEIIDASVGQTTSPASNINHCSITYYDDMSTPSVYLILKQDGSKITLGASPMRTTPKFELTRLP